MLMASTSKALGKITGCVQQNKVPYNKGRETDAQEQRKIKKERAWSPKLYTYCYPHRLWLQVQSNFFSFRHILSCSLLWFSHTAKQYWEQWFFNYVVTAIWTMAGLMIELQLVFSTSTELTGMSQSQANKSHLQQNTAAASCSLCMLPALLQSLGYHTSGDTHWIAPKKLVIFK